MLSKLTVDIHVSVSSYSDLMLLVGWQERHPVCKSSATTITNSLLLRTGLTCSNITWQIQAHHASSSRHFALPVPQRIQFKIAALAFDCVRDTGPAYFIHVIHAVADIYGRSGLRSAVQGDLFVPWTRTTKFGRRSFSIAAAVIWNSVPPHLRSPSISLRQFLAGLKTHLFKEAYTDNVWELLLKTDLNWTE